MKRFNDYIREQYGLRKKPNRRGAFAGGGRESDNPWDGGDFGSRPTDMTHISGQGGYSRPVQTSGTDDGIDDNWQNDNDMLIWGNRRGTDAFGNPNPVVDPADKPTDETETDMDLGTYDEPLGDPTLFDDPYAYAGVTNSYGMLRKKNINFNEI